jgi:signal transduction histidine kinase
LTTYLARQSNVRVEVNHEDGAIMLSYDGQQIDQVFTNLIQNAIQAMPEGGELTIATKREGEYAIIGFRDTGSGIPEESVARIFDPFFTTKPEGEGTGLGLSVSQGIIKKHNGKITVDSEVGVGTSFVVYLPLDEGEAQ